VIICRCSLHNPSSEKAALHYHSVESETKYSDIPGRTCPCSEAVEILHNLDFEFVDFELSLTRVCRHACLHLRACSCCASSATCACRCSNVPHVSGGVRFCVCVNCLLLMQVIESIISACRWLCTVLPDPESPIHPRHDP